jgi:hypothetical protein
VSGVGCGMVGGVEVCHPVGHGREGSGRCRAGAFDVRLAQR